LALGSVNRNHLTNSESAGAVVIRQHNILLTNGQVDRAAFEAKYKTALVAIIK
jgi:hypothetical protein